VRAERAAAPHDVIDAASGALREITALATLTNVVTVPFATLDVVEPGQTFTVAPLREDLAQASNACEALTVEGLVFEDASRDVRFSEIDVRRRSGIDQVAPRLS
jgi:hypothetical protein